jgi:large subunit ribosomal protein L6
MSKIGKQPITISDKVEVKVEDKKSCFGGDQVTVKGPKGELKVDLRPEVAVEEKDGELHVKLTKRSSKLVKGKKEAFWGLYRSLIDNAVEGVVNGYEKELEIVGIGYKAEKMSNGIKLHLGLTHPIEFEIPEGIEYDIKDSVKIKISGIDKQLVGQVAAHIRSLKKPEPYKGKGIRYKGEVIKKKVAKSAATAEGA